MATSERDINIDGANIRTDRRTEVRHSWSETKASIRTTELIVLVLAVAAVLIASTMDDSLNTDQAWTLVTALAIGYMISRGLAKSGSQHGADGGS